MNKSIKIGDEATLNCNVHGCSPNTRKTWYGGRNYDLLCYNDNSTNPSKYEMKSYKTTFNSSLTIKQFNFNDLNCVYTCACGFNRNTHMLKLDDFELVYGDVKDSSKCTDNRVIIAAEMKVYPIPTCSFVYKAQLYKTSVNRVELVKSKGNISEPYTVTINASLNFEPSESKSSINVTCQVKSSKFHFVLDINTDKDVGNDYFLFVLLVPVVGIILILIVLAVITISKKSRKFRKKKDPTRYYNSDVHQKSLSGPSEELLRGDH